MPSRRASNTSSNNNTCTASQPTAWSRRQARPSAFRQLAARMRGRAQRVAPPLSRCAALLTGTRRAWWLHHRLTRPPTTSLPCQRCTTSSSSTCTCSTPRLQRTSSPPRPTGVVQRWPPWATRCPPSATHPRVAWHSPGLSPAKQPTTRTHALLRMAHPTTFSTTITTISTTIRLPLLRLRRRLRATLCLVLRGAPDKHRLQEWLQEWACASKGMLSRRATSHSPTATPSPRPPSTRPTAQPRSRRQPPRTCPMPQRTTSARASPGQVPAQQPRCRAHPPEMRVQHRPTWDSQRTQPQPR
mmetsp:Transcript_20548/g.55328  ORF Transcript_20548/g.55328 Transcript_20548/m.55328 type:complete len:300 (+) Transcript_20548:631-1530(+)